MTAVDKSQYWISCACGCGKSFQPRNKTHRFLNAAHRWKGWKQTNPRTRLARGTPEERAQVRAEVLSWLRTVALSRATRTASADDIRQDHRAFLGPAIGSIFSGSEWEAHSIRTSKRRESKGRLLRVWRLRG